MRQPVIIQTKNNHPIILRKLNTNDLEHLPKYLHHLSDETKERFSPHHFDKTSILEFYSWPNEHMGFVAEDTEQASIIAYAIIKCGCLPQDKQRLESYGLKTEALKCGTFLTSVAEAWQSLGIGKQLLKFVLNEIKISGIEHVFLWGGALCSNAKEVSFYKAAGFKTLGQFEYFGLNYDMMLSIE